MKVNQHLNLNLFLIEFKKHNGSHLMYCHFIKINVCIDSIFSQSCYITVQEKGKGEYKIKILTMNIILMKGSWTLVLRE